MAPHSSTLAWKIPWTEEPVRLQSMGSLRVGHDWATSLSLLSCIGEGNGSPLQCSCLENPRDGGAWWAAVYGVAQSPTRLKWLSIAYRTSVGYALFSGLEEGAIITPILQMRKFGDLHKETQLVCTELVLDLALWLQSWASSPPLCALSTYVLLICCMLLHHLKIKLLFI